MAVEVDGTDNDALAVGGVLQGDARRHRALVLGYSMMVSVDTVLSRGIIHKSFRDSHSIVLKLKMQIKLVFPL